MPLLTKSVKVMVFPAVMLVVVSASKVTVLNVLFWVMLRVPAELVIGPVKVLLAEDRVKALVLEFCTIPVTSEPIAALKLVVADPVPLLVIVPVLLTEVVVKLSCCDPFNVKFPVPVMPPVIVIVLFTHPEPLPIVRLLFKVIAPLRVKLE